MKLSIQILKQHKNCIHIFDKPPYILDISPWLSCNLQVYKWVVTCFLLIILQAGLHNK